MTFLWEGGMWLKIRRFLKLLFPDGLYCFGCGAIIDDSRPYGLCDDCVAKFHWANKKVCEKCGKIMKEEGVFSRCSDCRADEPPMVQGFTCFLYGLYEREVIQAFKYGGAGYMADKLGRLLWDRLQPEIARGLTWDYIVPVPIHKKKKKKRGYNQAALLARRLGELSGIPVLEAGLVRVRNTPAMSHLDRHQRALNLEGAFRVHEKVAEKLSGKRLLLVDDVYTTGTTASQCTLVLMEQGAEAVYVITLAAGAN